MRYSHAIVERILLLAALTGLTAVPLPGARVLRPEGSPQPVATFRDRLAGDAVSVAGSNLAVSAPGDQGFRLGGPAAAVASDRPLTIPVWVLLHICFVLMAALMAITIRLLKKLNRLERRRADEISALLQQTQEASRLKSEFLANMGHELRTPLNGILGMSELLLIDSPRPDQAEALEAIQTSGQALLAVLNDVLEFSRMEAGEIVVRREAFRLRRSLDQAMAAKRARAEMKGLEVTCDYGSGVPEALIGDEELLRRVLGRLVGNAIKFTETGSVRVQVERLGSGADTVELKFTVADTGVGIAPEQVNRVFESFTQADGAPSRRYEGIGLGLTTARCLIDLMGGSIWVNSQPGAGTTFAFVLSFGSASGREASVDLEGCQLEPVT